MFGRPRSYNYRHPDLSLLTFYSEPSITSVYTKTYFHLKSLIKVRVFWNRFLGTAPSASWKVRQQTWRPKADCRKAPSCLSIFTCRYHCRQPSSKTSTTPRVSSSSQQARKSASSMILEPWNLSFKRRSKSTRKREKSPFTRRVEQGASIPWCVWH